MAVDDDAGAEPHSHPAVTPQPLRARGRLRRLIRARPMDVVDVFVYVVVLNLAVEYLPSVISESFTISLLTAVLLKITLEVVVIAKTAALTRFRASPSRRGRIMAGLLLWVVAAGSKVVVLEVVNLVFGGAVSLGGFWSVTALVVVLLLSRRAVRELLF